MRRGQTIPNILDVLNKQLFKFSYNNFILNSNRNSHKTQKKTSSIHLQLVKIPTKPLFNPKIPPYTLR